MAKYAVEKKLCVLFIWLARFFRLLYSSSMAKWVGFVATQIYNFLWLLLYENWDTFHSASFTNINKEF